MTKILFVFLICIVPAISCNTANKNPSGELYLATDFTPENSFTSGAEGPAVDKAGNLYAVNFSKEGTVGKITPAGESSIFLELKNGSIGNGIRFNKTGQMFIADYTNHNILMADVQTREVNVFAHEPKMNQPNDIAMDDAGTIYASDPNWKEGTGRIWRVNQDGTAVVLEDNMGTTNGIEVSPGSKYLYVNESVQRRVWVYDLSANGEISNKKLLITFDDFGMDGMRCDAEGNLYITRHGKGTVAKVSPEGKLMREIKLTGSKPSNIAFGGSDGKRAFVTLQDRSNIETFLVEAPGREWQINK